jgi:hypothetical protein
MEKGKHGAKTSMPVPRCTLLKPLYLEVALDGMAHVKEWNLQKVTKNYIAALPSPPPFAVQLTPDLSGLRATMEPRELGRVVEEFRQGSLRLHKTKAGARKLPQLVRHF